jgi:gpW
MAFDQNASVFAGMSQSALQTALTNAQQALIELKTGAQVVTVNYTVGGDTKHASYAKPNEAGLVELIGTLKACLGITDHARRGFRITF